MSNDVTDLFNERLSGIELCQDFPSYGRPFHFLINSICAFMLVFGFFGAYVVKIPCRKNHGRVPLLIFEELRRITRYPGRVPDPLEILFEIELHFDSDPVFEEVLLLFDKLRRKLSKTVFRVLAVCCATEIHLRIEHLMAAFLAPPFGFILKEFEGIPTFRTLGLEYGVEFPESWVLAGAFHRSIFLLSAARLTAAER
jgi:hypothetical protein